MTSRVDKRLAVGVIVLSTGLMQMHSVPFWQDYTSNDHSGLAFSIALEGAMLWLWYVNRRPKVRVIIAALLIAGPWYQVSVPVFERIGTVKTSAAMAESYWEEAEQLKGSLQTFEENSKKYRRSADRVDPIQARLDTARENYRKALSASEKSEAPWRLYAVTLMQAAAFLVVMLTQLEAVKFCRRGVSTLLKGVSENPETFQESVSEIPAPVETVETVSEMVLKLMKGFVSAAAFCKAYGLNERDVSNIRNGKPISRKKLEEMAAKLGGSPTLPLGEGKNTRQD